MTLIQTLVTPKHALQVSDRRLTKSDGSIFDDNHNKTVSWCGEITIAFTGIAFIDPKQEKPTSEWIAETLWRQHDLSDGVEKLRSEAERSIRRLPAWPDKRLSIMLAGFPGTAEGVRPMAIRLSNFEENSKLWPTHQSEFFQSNYFPEGPNSLCYLTSGAVLKEWQLDIVRKRVLRAIDRENDWNKAARLMVEIQRRVSGDNGTVGKDSLVVSLPSDPLMRGAMLTNLDSKDLNLENGNFAFFKNGSYSAERYGPHFVCGNQVFGDVKAESFGDDNSGQRISTRILKIGD